MLDRLFLGNRELHLRWFGRAHTSGDIFIHLPEENLLFTGDVAQDGGVPFIQDGYVRDWVGTDGRLLELKRFSEALGVPLNVQPRFFPVAADDAARLIVAAEMRHGSEAAMALTGAICAAVWAQERNIADAATLASLLQACGLEPDLLQRAHDSDVQSRYAENTQTAKDAGVFGAPSYVVDGELFWGQDRLDFVEQRLKA